jgi:sec-independent protein translocase protein TatA
MCQPFKTYINHHRIIHIGDYMFGLGTQEIILILIILLLLFGANKLPELARSLGVSVREFKKAVKEIEEEPKD